MVEDEETVRKVTARLLAKLGYEVHSARDARAALSMRRILVERNDLQQRY